MVFISNPNEILIVVIITSAISGEGIILEIAFGVKTVIANVEAAMINA